MPADDRGWASPLGRTGGPLRDEDLAEPIDFGLMDMLSLVSAISAGPWGCLLSCS